MAMPSYEVINRPDEAADTPLSRDSTVIFCGNCGAQHVVDNTRIESVHRSAEGLVGYVRCLAGHLVIHQLAEAYPKPKPPASVLEIRARLAADEQVSGG